MATYYIDPQNGKVGNSGLSEEEPLITNKGLKVKGGDAVLFKRGSFIRDVLWNVNGEEGHPILYGAYGEGSNPVFCGSMDVSREEDWVEVETGIWKCVYPLMTEVCNFIFDGARCGVLQWEKSDLKHQGDWWDSGWGEDIQAAEDHEVLICCSGNPAKYYKQIECVIKEHKQLAQTGHDMIIQDLTFCNNTHGIAGEDISRNLVISHCRFEYIGGCVWNKQRKIRYGNAVECWNGAENVVVDHCTFYEIYDSGVTHQGGAKCQAADGFWIRDNIFIACGMAAYEQRDVLPKKGAFVNNVCLDAGCGFSHFRTSLPRNSEIWPQPMGHHIFLWRIEKPTEGSCFVIENNLFMDAPYGTAIYSIICKEAEDQLIINDNNYRMEKCALFNRLHGLNYSDFKEYVLKTGKEDQSREVKYSSSCEITAL